MKTVTARTTFISLANCKIFFALECGLIHSGGSRAVPTDQCSLDEIRQNIGAFPLELAISSTENYGYTIDDLKNMIYESLLQAYCVSLFCNEQNIFPRRDQKI